MKPRKEWQSVSCCLFISNRIRRFLKTPPTPWRLLCGRRRRGAEARRSQCRVSYYCFSLLSRCSRCRASPWPSPSIDTGAFPPRNPIPSSRTRRRAAPSPEDSRRSSNKTNTSPSSRTAKNTDPRWRKNPNEVWQAYNNYFITLPLVFSAKLNHVDCFKISVAALFLKVKINFIADEGQPTRHWEIEIEYL